MFFVVKLHLPKFSLTDYEKDVEKKISGEFLSSSENNIYKHQLELKKHVSIMANSLHQLKGVSSSNNISKLEDEIRKAILFCLNSRPHKVSSQAFWSANEKQLKNITRLKNSFTLVEHEVRESKGDKIFSGLCIITNSILFCVGAVGALACGAAMLGTPIGLTFVALGLAVLSAALMAALAYTIYVDGKSLFNKQLNDINKGIEFLIGYPSMITGKTESEMSDNNFIESVIPDKSSLLTSTP